jgi:hypothetical protein
MRQRTDGGWFLRLVFAVPMIAAVSLLGLLGLLGILYLCDAGTLCHQVWTVFLIAAAGFLGFVFLSRVVVLVGAVIGMILLTVYRGSQGAALLVRTAFRGF